MYDNFSPNQSFGYQDFYNTYPMQTMQQPTNAYSRDIQQGNFTQQSGTNITFVNGIEGAKAIQLSPNSRVLMMDSDSQRFFVKTTDNLGVAKITSYSFEEDNNSSTNNGIFEKAPEKTNVDSNAIEEMKQKISELEAFRSEVEKKIGELL